MTKRDRKGTEIGILRWGALRGDVNYHVVAQDQVGDIVVRTVWDGFDEPPGAMFATGIAVAGTDRFTTLIESDTEPQALERHAQVLDLARQDRDGVAGRLRVALTAALASSRS
ncbi:hypothetical protein [Amycolatopsis magusensis]|uniref:hypothetical protein n=1 Tax=Amycolatopsis magusensis TaxID=882444 RepID=UPI0037AC36D5